MKLDVNDISYFVHIYQQDETKENLILLHGFMGSGRAFESAIEALQAFCNPITIDLLGHGKTEAASSPGRFQSQKQADDLSVIIQKISNEQIFLHGYSMGGRLALQLAQAKPELLKGLILESTNPGMKNKRERNERKRLDEQRAKKIESNFGTFLEEWKLLPLFRSEIDTDEDLKRYDEIQQQQNPQQMAFSLRGFGTGQMSAINLEKIEVPVLLLAGEKDEKYVRIMKGMNRRLPKSRLKIISGARHRVHLDKPDAFVNELKEFIS